MSSNVISLIFPILFGCLGSAVLLIVTAVAETITKTSIPVFYRKTYKEMSVADVLVAILIPGIIFGVIMDIVLCLS